ncbi:MAG: leucine--tRNA ligase [Candidatus Thermoplasmatota archaeon]|nr:leucine--tRNA ligase [Candidatus Thermoplasmatota archaeon]
MASDTYNYIKIEEKWQKKWFEEKIYLANKQNNKKFFIHFAYPGVSGYLHVGHMRGFTYCDIIARYKRMQKYDVIFPAGFHASGIPSIGFAKKVERKDNQTIKSLKEYGLDEKHIQKLSDPNEVVTYFAKVYVEDYWKKFGFLIDYSRIMSTISEGYKKFITWQFLKLKEKNLLIKKPHFAPFCPNCGPVAVDKSETDISKGGSSEILEFTVIKFIMTDKTILPAATLRPETIFGVTNMWINPDVEYIKAKIGSEKWILSKQAFEKLKNQIDNVEETNEKIKGKDLIGNTCKIPIIGREIPLLSGSFADPNVATGIVMSVPAHAPFDWIALVESGENIEPITIIDVKGYGTNPAKQECEKLGIKSQNETEKLDLATEEVYKNEYHKGYLNEKCAKYAGIKISDIKDEVKNELINNNHATLMREFSEEVICRCQTPVLIKQIPDQWFIKYSDIDLTDQTKKYSESMNIYPQDYKNELPGVLDWFDDRACIRQGSWLGTEFPFKKGWIIEPISDSTLYPAYYVISKYVNEEKIKPSDMTEQFFDYIFLNKGKSQKPIWYEIKKDFDYWYPVDINLGGKEHKTVHFPVFLMNHVAVMPKEKRPRGIFVHWWVTQKGKEKISKSKGGAEHIKEAATKYGVDSMRLYYAHVGSPFVDIEWDEETVTKYKNRLANIFKQIQSFKELKNQKNENLDKWLRSNLQRTIKKTFDAFENFDLRVATNEIFFEMQKTISWYIKRGGSNKEIIDSFVKNWLLLMTPITPHMSEELWTNYAKSGFISNEFYSKFDETKISEKDEIGEYLLQGVTDDISEILKVTKIIPKKIFIYTSPSWKQKIFRKAITLKSENKLEMRMFMKEIMSEPSMKSNAKQVSQYASKIFGEVKKLSESDKNKYIAEINEKDYLKSAEEYLKKLFSSEIKIFNTDDKDIYDPEGKTRFAVPLRPAIFIE